MFVNLFIGLSITTAVGLMMVGSLNLLSIAFAVLFVGLGVDFGIQFSVRYRSERFKNDNLVEALGRRRSRVAVPLSLAAMATAAGFLCFLPTDYKGISELGEIAGAGMLIAFLSSITVLPAILKLINPPGESEPVGYAFLAPVDRFLENHRVAIVAGTLLIALAGLPLLYFMKFDFNPMNLRNPKAEVDRDLPRSAQGSEHRRQCDQRADAFGRGCEEDRGEARQTARSAARAVARQLRARRSAGQAEADRAGRPRCSIPRSIRIRSTRRPPDQENVDSLKSSVENLRRTAGDGKGAGAVASKRLADALEKLANAGRGHAQQGAGDLRRSR